MSEKIDFVIAWVDDNDPNWQAEKSRYDSASSGDSRDNRFRDWDNLQYWFRGVEKFTPWVNKIFFVTWGHLPKWLNCIHSKLQVIKHYDYIPKEYLPTFNARTIELNLHRINSLADKFVYFNDDMFIIKKMNQDEFFKKGLPCDSAVLMPSISSFRYSTGGTISNNMEIINTTFNKSEVMWKNPFKWFNLKYKINLLSTICSMPYKHFVGFYNSHLPNSFLKKTFIDVWEIENELLHNTCLRKFRECRDVNQWLIRYWQLVTGSFVPRNISIGKYYSLTNNNQIVIETINGQKYKMVCLNDDNRDPIEHFSYEKKLIRNAFENIFPKKSSFEL